MSTTIPTNEPLKVRAGSSVKWNRDFSDYPAATWTLTYSLLHQSNSKITITASASGNQHQVRETPATTAAWTAGDYHWLAEVTDGTDVYVVDQGVLTVQDDLAAASTYDGRTWAETTLSTVETALTTILGDPNAAVTIGENTYNRQSLGELRAFRDRLKAEIKQAEVARRIEAGLGSGRLIQVRF